jgi:hypothetical protein
MDILEKWKSLPPFGIWIPDHQSIVQSPYRLNYPSSCCFIVQIFFRNITGHRISRNIYTSDTHTQYFPVYLCANSSLATTASGPSSPQLPCLIKWISRTIFVTLQEHINDQFKQTCGPSPVTKYFLFWDVMLSSLTRICQLFERPCCLHLQVMQPSHPQRQYSSVTTTRNFRSLSLLTLGTGTEFSYGSPVQMSHGFPSTRHVSRPLWITNLFPISQCRLFCMDTLVLTMFKCF